MPQRSAVSSRSSNNRKFSPEGTPGAVVFRSQSLLRQGLVRRHPRAALGGGRTPRAPFGSKQKDKARGGKEAQVKRDARTKGELEEKKKV